jgi:Cys-tRNA(Pro)/Cys-tRNA(Cys) deacylase
MTKTHAMRLLESKGMPFEIREYDVDPDDLSAETVARKIAIPIEQVFKTLLIRGDRNGLCFAVIPGNTELDLKTVAKSTGDRKVDLVTVKELQSLTGYVRGGVTALAAKKKFPVLLDETAELFDLISVSAGQRGIQILLKPQDYVRVTDAKLGMWGR